MPRTSKTPKRRTPKPPQTTTILKSVPVADLQRTTAPASRQIVAGTGVVIVKGRGI